MILALLFFFAATVSLHAGRAENAVFWTLLACLWLVPWLTARVLRWRARVAVFRGVAHKAAPAPRSPHPSTFGIRGGRS